MTPIGRTPSQPDAPLWRGGRVHGRTRLLASLLTSAMALATVGCHEDSESPTAPEPGPALIIQGAHTLSFRQLTAGEFHTCGVISDHRAYCWGQNLRSQLGDGTGTPRRLTPVAVAGGLQFSQLSSGPTHTCGVSLDDLAYCWGSNFAGQLGDGTPYQRSTPVAVAGGLRFRQVSAGGAQSCGVTVDDLAYCWGDNGRGQLGDGTTVGRTSPVAVAGGLRFREVKTGGHTCGVTPDSRAYCWGYNDFGELGDGTTTQRLTPTPVVGGLLFRQVIAGFDGSCGVTLDNRAYCWGYNGFGALGDGTRTNRLRPVKVAGGLRFSQVSGWSAFYTCGVTTGYRAYCWGYNAFGQLGDGTKTDHLRPVAVSGGFRFREVTAAGGSYGHTCGVTTGNRAYCWGSNDNGQLGDRTTSDRLTPVLVASWH